MSVPDPAVTDWVPIGGVGGVVPVCRVTHNAPQAGSGFTVLAFNTEIFDTDNMHDAVTNNSRLTCRTAGLYMLGGTVAWTGATGGYRDIVVRHNATTWIGIQRVVATTSDQPISSVATLYQLAVNDYVELLFSNSIGSINAEYNNGWSPIFWAAKVG